MAKSVTALKNLLKAEEKVLERLTVTIALIAHKETKSVLREVLKNKKVEIRCYKQIIKAAEKCPAVKKPAAKKTRGTCKTTTKRGACKSSRSAQKATKKTTTKKTTKKR